MSTSRNHGSALPSSPRPIVYPKVAGGFPSILELAKAMGMNPRNIQRRLRRMEAVGFIRIGKRNTRHGGHKGNEYDLTPLIKAATKLVLEEMTRRKNVGLAKLGRKTLPGLKPSLEVVKA